MRKMKLSTTSQAFVRTLRACAVFGLAVLIPQMAGASFNMTEDIAVAEVNGTLTLNGNTLTTKSWVQGDNSVDNLFFTKFTYKGTGTRNVAVSLTPGLSNTNRTSNGSSADVMYIDVAAERC